jgi:creatinine amidohydrolase
MSEVRRWAELTRDEISSLAPEALIVLPVGTTEQHGPHLATGTDAALVEAVAGEAAGLAAHPQIILLAPTLAYGASDHHLPFGGTLSLRAATMQAVLADLLASAAACGCRRIFVLNGHGGNAAVCSTAVAEASREHGILAATALFSQLVDPDTLQIQVTGHAGVFETSLMLALHPDRVRPERAAASPGGPARKRARGLVVGEPGRWQELDGYTDRPDQASAAIGQAALHAASTAAAAAFEEVARLAV